MGKNIFSIISILLVCMSCHELYTHERVVGQPLKVVCTTGIIGDALRNIGGDAIQLEILMGPGVDPHTYKATHGDLQKLLKADVIFYNGLHLEGKMSEVLIKLNALKPVIPISDGLSEEIIQMSDPETTIPDPHIWFDVTIWSKALEYTSEKLMEIDSANATIYKANSKKYLSTLAELHEEIKQQISTIDPKRRILITAHDAFGYFGKAYGLEVYGLQGISTISEFGLYELTHLVDFIVDKRIPAVFPETSISDRSVKALQEGCQKRKWNITMGGHLYSDALGKTGSQTGTYEGMLRSNINSIVSALK